MDQINNIKLIILKILQERKRLHFYINVSIENVKQF